MKLNIKIDTSLEEPEALITVPRMKIGSASCRERV